MVESSEKEMVVSIAFLPNQLPFELSIGEKQLGEIVGKTNGKILQMVEEVVKKHRNIREMLIVGGSVELP
jgi:hypothetical protein